MAQSIDPRILLEHTGWLRKLATELAGDAHKGDDAVQDTWLAFVRNPPRETKGPGLRAWLARTVRHAALGEARAQSRRERREAARYRPERTPSVAESVERVELQQRIVSAVMALRSPDREIVVLRYFEDVPPRDIAARLSLSPNVVRTRLSRALHRLRDALDDTYGSRRNWAMVALPLAAKGGLVMKTAAQVVGALLVIGGVWFAVAGDRRDVELELTERALSNADLISTPAVQAPKEPTIEAPERDADARVALAEPPAVDDPDAAPTTTPMLRLEGRCLDELGRPLANVRAVARSSDAPPQFTRADGTFALELTWSPQVWSTGFLYVDFTRDGLANVFTRVKPTEPGVLPVPDVTLWRGGVLSGRVVDEAGAPLAHVSVTPVEPWPEDDALARDRARAFGVRTIGVARTSTDANGAYTLHGVPVETVRVQAIQPDRLMSFSPPTAVDADRRVEVAEIVMHEPGPEDVIRGTLVDPLGEPVTGARILQRAASGDVLQQRVAWVNSPDGRFTVLAARGSAYSLEATDPRSRWGPARLEELHGGDEVELRFSDEGSRTVLFVHDPRGQPVLDFQVRLSLEDHTPSSAAVRMSGPGRRDVTWPGQPFHVRIQAHGFRSRSIGPLDPAELEEELSIQLEPMEGLHGLVVAGGAPVPNANVHAHPVLQDREWIVFGAGFACGVERTWTPPSGTNEDGSFFAPIAEPGRYVVHASAPGYALTERGPVSFEPGARVQPLELELSSGGALEGRVLTSPGVSPGGWTIAISRGDAHVEDTRVSSEGLYRFEHLAPGSWQVIRLLPDQVQTGIHGGFVAQEPDYEPAFDVTVTAGNTTHFDLDLRDEVPCRIHGLVRIGGSPPPGHRVTLANDDIRKWPSLDPTGRYSVVVPRPETYQLTLLSFSHAGMRVELTDERVIQAGDNDWTIDLPGGTVELANLERGRTYGLVREDDGTPRWFARFEATDDESIVLGHVPAGAYRWTRAPAGTAGRMPHGWLVIRSFELGPDERELLRSP